MCGSMVDIQYATVENRWGKKKEETTAVKYNVRCLLHMGGHKEEERNHICKILDGHNDRKCASNFSWCSSVTVTRRRRQPIQSYSPGCASVPSNALALPSAHPSPQTKRQIERFSHFCTAHGKVSSGMPGHVLSPNNCLFTWGSGPHLTHDSLGLSMPTTETASRSVQPFLHRWPQSVPILCNGTPLPPQNCPFPWRGSGPRLIHGSLGHPSPQSKRHLDRFSRFCRADSLVWQTDRQTTLLGR